MIPPLIAVVGETASGKSALALELAQEFDGEIICADSRTIYKHMDIGTAKPTREDRQKVEHHVLDVIEPNQQFSAAAFQQLANEAIRDIAVRGKVPLLVGGTGLYIDAVLFDFKFRAPASLELRAELSQLSVDALQQRVHDAGLELPINAQNPRHLIRILETNGQASEKSELRQNTVIIGLQIDREVLERRISDRINKMIADGFEDEVRQLADMYGWDSPGLQAPGYRAFRQYCEGLATLDEARAQFIKNDLKLAKRQRTWFRRNKSIHWVNDKAEAVELATTLLNK